MPERRSAQCANASVFVFAIHRYAGYRAVFRDGLTIWIGSLERDRNMLATQPVHVGFAEAARQDI
jgi:hypothetical protein